ncbi:MAG: thiamine-phosphate kinase [Candidatus Methanofastidiosia archaeon]
MRISDIGGEFGLIKRLADKKTDDPAIVKGIGDDCSVLKYVDGKYLLVTTDMLVENIHFNLKWQSPFQVGVKLMEANVSDIVAMGGTPKYALLSMSIKKDTSVEFMDELYRGIYASSNRHNIALIGGDTIHGTEYAFSVTLLGEVDKKLLRLRSMARVGDLICVTGRLGGSSAGLILLSHDKKDYSSRYLEPRSRSAEEGRTIAKHANAMIDVSDGLGSEVRHICDESNTGARIDFEKIPLSDAVIEAVKFVSQDPHYLALYSGEDFEIVFTLSKENVAKLRKEFSDFNVIGKIIDDKEGVYISKGKQKIEIKGGYDHFL